MLFLYYLKNITHSSFLVYEKNLLCQSLLSYFITTRYSIRSLPTKQQVGGSSPPALTKTVERRFCHLKRVGEKFIRREAEAHHRPQDAVD
jgi:hypothetical protein